MAPTSQAHIARDLQALGVRSGDLIAVHSSLSSLGHVDGGAETVVDAILDAIGPGGTLVMPAFVRGFGPESHLPPEQRSIVTGAIPAALAQRSGTRRSFAGPGSLVATGPLADTLTAGAGPRFVDGPLGEVYRRNGRILLLGVGQRRNTSLHVAEELAALYTPSYHGAAFGRMDDYLANSGLLTTGPVAQATAQLMSATEVVDATIDLLRRDPLALWCGDEECPRCQSVLAAGRRRRR